MGRLDGQWLSSSLFPFICTSIWFITSHIISTFPTLQGKRICLLIAHPDDEAMFFAPTLLALADPELGNHIKILCLSSGDADGLGEVRKQELIQSALTLGISNAEDVKVIEDSNFPDSMTTHWDATLITNTLANAFAPEVVSKSPKDRPHASIDVLITFDADGVSSHPNHRSLYHGARAFLEAIMRRHSGWECPVTLYSLSTTNVVRKYLSFLDAPLTLLVGVLRGRAVKGAPSPLIFVNTPIGYRTAQRAMTRAHESQMRWFRWGWIGVSRYMVINDLRKETVDG